MKPIPKKWLVELALPVGTEEPQDTFLDEFGDWPPAKYVNANNIVHYDSIKLDSLLCLRLHTNHTGTPLLKLIEYHCKVASESQNLYRSISRKQWLRTIITSDKPRNIFFPKEHRDKANLEIHSNVVPREAYLKATCRAHQNCTRGFTRACEIFGKNSTIPEMLAFQSCGDCAFAKTLIGSKTDGKADSEFPTVLKFQVLGMKEVELLDDLAPGAEGDSDDSAICKVLWRKGVFVRKRFKHVEEEEEIPHEGYIQNPSINRELDVALSVSHPNLVHYFGCSKWVASESEGFLFMELLMEDLGTFLLEVARDDVLAASFTFRDRLDVLLQVAQAMQHLHQMNFVHGDLKPQNIFMSRFELAHSGVQYYLMKVGDFGCAQRADSDSGATVEPFFFDIGTLNYTAPEVLRCRKEKGALVPKHPQKIDVYSFGVVAYQVLTGVTHLYEDLGRNVPQGVRGKRMAKSQFIKEEIMNNRLRPDVNFKGTLDRDMLPYIRRCWAQEPEMRPSFSEICETLSWIIQDLDLGFRGKSGILPILQSYNCAEVSSSSRSEFISNL